MRSHNIPAKIDEFSILSQTSMDMSVVIPAVTGKWYMKYAKHTHYFMNFRTLRGLRARLNHLDVIRPGWKRLRMAADRESMNMSIFQPLAPRYHYGFNLIEQVMLMTVPHTVTPVGNGRFIVNLWSWCGYLLVDITTKTVTYCIMEELDEDSVLGSQQWFDPKTTDLYAMSYSLSDSMARIKDATRPVSFKIFKHQPAEDGTEIVWQGELSDYTHDILVNTTRQYCAVCELGMYLDKKGNIIPSKVLIVDLKSKQHWVLERFAVAAHASFDPDEPNTIYFSNHNFEFQHTNILRLMKKGSYSVSFQGPTSIYKYELTADGPRETGVFTQDNFYRLTNMHVFNHRGRKIIAAIGFPDVVFLIEAKSMTFIRKLTVKDPLSFKHFYSKRPALIGSISPSLDGEKLFVQTTASFQIVDIDTGDAEYIRDYFFSHTCFNHMVTSNDTDW